MSLDTVLLLAGVVLIGLELVVPGGILGAVGFVSGQQTGSGYMSRVFGIGFHVGHIVDDSGKHDVPTLGGVFVDTYFDAFQHVDDCRQFEQGVFEFEGNLFTFFRRTGKFESDNVFYHNSNIFYKLYNRSRAACTFSSVM